MPKREDEFHAASKGPHGVGLCPFCGSRDIAFDEMARKWHCRNKNCDRRFPTPSYGPAGKPKAPGGWVSKLFRRNDS